ncbi:MAG TPA: flagellar protein FlaG [Sulfuricella sp.]|nr:flagellar protein FlaG [Sulfuricella sp.]
MEIQQLNVIPPNVSHPEPGVQKTAQEQVAVKQDSHVPVSAGAVQAASQTIDGNHVKQAVDKVNKVVQALANASDLEFNVDEGTGKVVVKVVDKATKEVIRQIPSEEMLSIARSLDKLQGLLIKQKV